MKWGNKHKNGCLSDCGKVHPLLCPKFLDLKCVDKPCSYKLHTLKCVRHDQVSAAGAAPGQGQQGVGQLTRVGLIRINHLRVRLGLTWLVGELGLYLAISDNNIKHPLEVLVEVELVK